MKEINAKRILIMRPEHIGDFVVTLPILSTIRKKFPEAIIDIVVGPWNEKLAKATPYVDNVIVFENPLVERNMTYKKMLKISILKTRKVMRHARQLNKKKYDILIDFSDRKFSKIFDKMIKAKKKVLGINYSYSGGTEQERLEKIITSGLGMKNILKKTKIRHSNQDKKIIDELISKMKLGKKKIILLQVLTPLKEKNWPVHKWKDLINRISEKRKDVVFLLIGGPDQKDKIERIVRDLGRENVKNIAGQTSILQLVYLIEKSDLMIGGCSGPVNSARLTGTPIITLFGPTSAEKWAPPKGQGGFLQKIPISKIDVGEVFLLVKKFL